MATGDQTRPFPGRVHTRASIRTARFPWAFGALLLGTLIVLIGAYIVRPDVVLNVGTRYDAPYLANSSINDREFRATAPTRDYAWPAGSDTLEIREGLNPDFQMATLTLDEFTPSATFPRRLISVYANGDEIANWEDKGGAREFRVLLPAGAAQTRTLTLRAHTIPDRYSLELPPLQVQKATLSAARTYRWTTDRSTITFPAVGRGNWRVTLRTIVHHPDNTPVQAQLVANGVTVANLPDYAGVRNISTIIPADVVGTGDLTLELRATPFQDPRTLGVLIEQISLTPVGARDLGAALPPWSTLLPALVIVLCAYGTLRRVNISPWIAAAVGLIIALVGAWALTQYRVTMGFYLRPLAVLMVFSLAVALFINWFSDWLFHKLDIPLVPWLRRSLVLICIIGFWLKAGGLIFPYMRAIDIQWHMEWTRGLLNGRVSFADLYGINSPLNELTMPVDEWGEERPVIPYSPFFQLFAVLFSIFPWRLETTANVMSALLDNTRIFLIAMLTLKAGLSNRVTLLAALLYAITPVTFLLHAWGNVPTTFGMWLALVAMTIIIVVYPKLHRPLPFALLTFVTLCCFLFYTVMAAFHVMFVLSFVVMAWLMRRWVDPRPLRPMLLATGLAFLLSLAIYYGQYIPPVLSKTLPYMATIFSQGPQTVGVERPPLSQYMLSFLPHLGYWIWPGRYLYYGLLLPLLAVIPGFVMLRKHQPLWAALAAWFTVAVLFMFAGYRISMVDKQLFYILPPISICAAVVADWFWKRGLWGRLLMGAVYVGTFVSAISLWLIRIYRSPFG